MGNSKPLVSIILPFYNAPYLKEAIESILSQTYPNFELILVDNGSTDQSKETAESFINHPNVILINESEKGVVHAANKGIELASGEFIARMDADDISYKDRLESQVQMFNDDPSVGVVSGLISYLGNSKNEGFIHYVDWLNSIKTADEINLNQFVEFPLANPTLMFRREIFARYGGFRDGDFPEDYEFFLRLQSSQIKMTKVDETVLSWRDTETRLTRTDPRYSQDAFFRLKAKYLAKWLALNNPFHPYIFLWGAGRRARRRSDYLLSEGIKVIKYIDLKDNDKVMHYKSIPDPSDAFIVSYVGSRGARTEIRSFLNGKGFNEGNNYIIAS
ncbi:glycosyltransferase [Ekhidna sp.]|uniref:glycosyltransferase n=1 Tax=Ekhidna sp. TaxID=2608089 RepID=UPI003298BBB9